MKQMPVESFFAGVRQADLGGDAAHLGLLELADRKERARELRLAQPVQEVALVLVRVEPLQQLEAARLGLAHPRVVAGRDAFGAEPHRVVEEGLELDLGVAQHVGIGRAPGLVLAQELGEDAVLVLGGEIDVLDLDADHVGDAGRVEEVLARRAVLVVVVLLPVLHEDADHLVAGALQQPRGDGRIDAAGEADDDALRAGGGHGVSARRAAAAAWLNRRGQPLLQVCRGRRGRHGGALRHPRRPRGGRRARAAARRRARRLGRRAGRLRRQCRVHVPATPVRRPARWLRFQVTAVVGAVLSFALVALGVRAGLHYLLAQVVATCINLVVTFEINRRWSFASTTSTPTVTPASARSAAKSGLGEVGRFAPARSGDRIGCVAGAGARVAEEQAAFGRARRRATACISAPVVDGGEVVGAEQDAVVGDAARDERALQRAAAARFDHPSLQRRAGAEQAAGVAHGRHDRPVRDRVEDDLAHAGQRVDVLMAVDERGLARPRRRRRHRPGRANSAVDRRPRQGAQARQREQARQPGQGWPVRARGQRCSGVPSVRLKCRPRSSGRFRPDQHRRRTVPARRVGDARRGADAAHRPRARRPSRRRRRPGRRRRRRPPRTRRRGALTTMPRPLRRSARCRGAPGRRGAA